MPTPIAVAVMELVPLSLAKRAPSCQVLVPTPAVVLLAILLWAPPARRLSMLGVSSATEVGSMVEPAPQPCATELLLAREGLRSGHRHKIVRRRDSDNLEQALEFHRHGEHPIS